MRTADLFEKVIEVHGGRDRWKAVNVIEVSFSSGGLAFASHLQPFALRDLKISLMPHSRQMAMNGYCHPEWCGIWTPTYVQIMDGDDSLVAERCNPRESFSRIDKQFRWDKLDLLYFAGYALWNYLCFPFILDENGVTVIESDDNSKLRRLIAKFDARVPTHSATQTFHVDESGLLFRHDYTANVIGHWATAANYCLASERVGGLRFYTRRQVRPRFGQHVVLPFPTLVWIEIDDIHLVSSRASNSSEHKAAA